VVVVAASLRCLNLTSVFLYLTAGCMAEEERVGGDAAVILSLDSSGAVGGSVLGGGLASGLGLGGGITELSRVTRLGVLVAMMSSSACSLLVVLASPLWPTCEEEEEEEEEEFWKSCSIAENLAQLSLDLVTVSICSTPLPRPTLPLWPLRKSGLSCLVVLLLLRDLVLVQWSLWMMGGGGVGGLPMRGVFMGGAVKG
jgi:hypothetical protein